MSIVTLYPVNEYFEFGAGSDAAGRTVTGAANAAAALDASDTSYIQSTAGTNQMFAYYGFTDPTLPAGAKIAQMRVTLRQARTTAVMQGNAFQLGYRWSVNGGKNLKNFPAVPPIAPSVPTGGVFADYVGPWLTATDNGVTWQKVEEVVVPFIGPIEWVVMACFGFEGAPPSDTGAKISMLKLEIQYNEIPVVSAILPSGNIVTARPTISWTYTDPDGDPQQKKQVRIFDSATYGAGGFDPDTATPAYDSGIKVAGGPVHPVVADLTNGVTYKAYVKVWQAQVAGEDMTSVWTAGPAFTVALDAPATPILTASFDSANARAVLAVQDTQNEMSFNASTIDTNALAWATTVNATSTTSSAQALHGANSLLLTSVAAGNMSVSTGIGTAGFGVAPSKPYTAMANVRRGGATARTARVDIAWYTSGGSFISTSTGGTASPAQDWVTQLTCTATAPATAAFATVILNVLATAAAGETFYWDKMGFRPGSNTTWFAGGYNTVKETVIIERSYDQVAWAPIRTSGAVDPDVAQTMTLYDYEVPPLKTAYYRARVSNVSSTNVVVSANTATQSTVATQSVWWLKDPIDPTRNVAVQLRDFKLRYPKPNVKGFPVGQSTITMSHDGLKSAVLSCVMYALTSVQYAAFMTLFQSGRTLLLQDVLGRQWYVQPEDDIQFSMLRSVKLVAETTPIRHAHEVDLTLIEVEAP